MNENCLTKNCMRPAAVAMKRGLCLICYSRAKKMVESGTTTWGQLVEMKLALPSDTEGADPFTQAFNEAKRRKDAGEATS
jgi:hypothetical protein